MSYIRAKSGTGTATEFKNWVVRKLGLEPTQVRTVDRWIAGTSEPGMKTTLGLLYAAEILTPLPLEGLSEQDARDVVNEAAGHPAMEPRQGGPRSRRPHV